MNNNKCADKIKTINSMEKLRARIGAIMPRGSTYNKPKNYRRSIELIYEWEKGN